MNSLERVRQTLNLGPADRPPVLPQIYGYTAGLAGVPLRDYVTDGATIARCQLQALAELDHDGVFAVSDNSIEAEALGCRVEFPAGAYPYIRERCLDGPSHLDRLRVPDPEKDGRMPEILKACRLLRDAVGRERVVIGNALGPVTVAGQAMGLEHLLYLIADDPDGLRAVLDLAAQVTVAYARAQLRAGAHVTVLYEPSASPAVIPRPVFERFARPVLHKTLAELRDSGTFCRWLHIAGPTQSILSMYPEMGVDLASFDYQVPVTAALALLPNTCLIGNLKPYLFVSGSAPEVERQARDLLGAAVDRGGLILSSGCEIPPEAGPENIRAMVRAARDFQAPEAGFSRS